jgi:hypothetical protein
MSVQAYPPGPCELLHVHGPHAGVFVSEDLVFRGESLLAAGQDQSCLLASCCLADQARTATTSAVCANSMDAQTSHIQNSNP